MPRLIFTRSFVTSLPSTIDAGRDEHLAAPVGHVAVLEVAGLRILEGAPAAEQHAALADLFVSGQRLVEEVEEVVVHRHDLLHELDVLHQADEIVGERLDRRHRADAAGIERRRVHVASFHQAEHLAREPAHHQRLAVELAFERVQRPHDVADRAVAVSPALRRLGLAALSPRRPGWSRGPSFRRSRRRPGSPERCCGRTCTRRLRRG